MPYVTNKAYRINEIYNPNKLTKLLCFKIEGITISIGDVIIKSIARKNSQIRQKNEVGNERNPVRDCKGNRRVVGKRQRLYKGNQFNLMERERAEV